ncbi:hypothetical protein Fot_29856 [Forsythia ovata]|uniref:Uncharacterized protein n=1 Tax=Forsythia ovata TaxID=205694 RepID=A0ABD1TTW3_9LAMI
MESKTTSSYAWVLPFSATIFPRSSPLTLFFCASSTLVPPSVGQSRCLAANVCVASDQLHDWCSNISSPFPYISNYNIRVKGGVSTVHQISTKDQNGTVFIHLPWSPRRRRLMRGSCLFLPQFFHDLLPLLSSSVLLQHWYLLPSVNRAVLLPMSA